MLGTELSSLLATAGVDYFCTDRECDITDPVALRNAAKGRSIQWLINCAAYTAVDRAEDEEALAYRINAQGAAHIAECAHELGAALVHISTDYVFSGNSREPYVEEDPTDPVGAYGRTKADGEVLIRKKCKSHFILRTAWLYGYYGSNFVYTMLRLMNERSSIAVVADQTGSPTWTRDLATAVIRIISTSSQKFGTYHFTNEGEITWHDFASEIFHLGLANGLIGREVEIKPIRTEQYPTRARRPLYSVLSKSKIREVMGCATPDWKDSLGRFISELAKRGLPPRVE
jgi:dTDP-4-dehydrorhamnose reductase